MASPSAWASAARGRIDPVSLLSSHGLTLCTSSRVLLIRTSATLGRFLPRLHLSPMTPTRASFPDAGTLSGSGDTGLGGCCAAQQCPPAAFPPACVPCTKPAQPGAEWTVAGSECPHPQALCGAGRGGAGVCHVCSCWQSIDRNVSCRFVTARPWPWLPRRSRRASPFASGAHARGGGAMVARLRQVLGPAETKPLFSPFRRCPWEADVPDVEIGQVINPHAPPGEEGVLKLLVTFCKH